MRKNVFVVALVLLIALVSCADHEHAWSEWKTIEESSCTEAGSRTRTCIGCNAVETENLPLKEHSYEWKVVLEPNCVDAGKSEQVCSVCGAKGETRDDEALGHEYGEDGKCIRCKNEKTKVEAAEARIGLVYYAKFEDAVYAAINATEPEKKVVEVLSDITTQKHKPELNGSLTINANNHRFSHDFSIYSNANEKVNTQHGIINIIINDAKNVQVWGQGQLLETGDVINVVLNNCHNDSEAYDETALAADGALMVMFRNEPVSSVKGTARITLKNCSIKGTKDAIHGNFIEQATFVNCNFEYCTVPVNISYAQSETCSVYIEDCTFSNCGVAADTTTNLAAGYSAPIRVTNKSENAATVEIKGTSIKDTKGTLGDVLLLEVRSGKTATNSVVAKLENNKSDIKVKASVEGELKTVEAGTSETIEVVLPSVST